MCSVLCKLMASSIDVNPQDANTARLIVRKDSIRCVGCGLVFVDRKIGRRKWRKYCSIKCRSRHYYDKYLGAVYYKKVNATSRRKRWSEERYKKKRVELSVLNGFEREATLIYALDVLCGSEFHQCARCTETDLRCLQIDHIVAVGSENRMGHLQMYRWIINNRHEAREMYQVLCSNCNWRKKWENVFEWGGIPLTVIENVN